MKKLLVLCFLILPGASVFASEEIAIVDLNKIVEFGDIIEV